MEPAARYPDISYIREKVSIVSVAMALDLRVVGYRAQCWRLENHQNGDRDPSIGFQRKENRGRCFVCDPHTWSNIDLVMMVRGCEMMAAVHWIAKRFPVPDLPKGTHIRNRDSFYPRFLASVDDSVIGQVVQCGIWAELSPCEAKILAALVTFANRTDGNCEMSYKAILRYSGVGSHATVAKALRHFEQMGFLKVHRSAESRNNRHVNGYSLTLDDPGFQTLMSTIYQRQREEMEVERILREQQRRERRRQAPV